MGAVLALCLLPAGNAAEGTADDRGAVARVEQVLPEIFYLRDDAGQLVPVPGFRYRDFVDLLRLTEGLPGLPEAPAAVERPTASSRSPSRCGSRGRAG